MKTKIMNKTSTFVLAVLALLMLFGVTIGTAAPGDLDLSFGSGGKVTTTTVITTGSGGIYDIAIQPDGKIVAVGGARIVRYNANGSLDSSFGTGGIVIIQLGDNISVFANSVAVQADGKIVVAGGSYNASTGYGFAVVRYNPNGTLDTSFNGTGKIFNPNQGGYASAVAIQTDGKLVVVGGARNANEEGYSVVFRYNLNGTPDTSFNGTGSIIKPESGASSVVIQPDGKIIVGGSVTSPYDPDYYFYAIFRYNAEGSPDTSFGDAGRVFSYSFWSNANQVAIQSDGKIVAKVGGLENSDFGNYPFTLIARYNPNGLLDATFGNNNGVIYENNQLNAGDLVIQPDGKIVSVSTSFGRSDFAVRRYNSYGFTDTTFNDEGLVTTDFGFASQDEPFAVTIQSDGKIVAAGVARYFQPDGNVFYHFALSRYQGGSSSRTRFDFDGDGRADVSVFRPSDRVWYLNQSTAGFSAAQFGLSTDKITPADFDGDGKTDISVYRDGTWYWLSSSNNYSFNTRQFGIAADIPVPADYTGDGRAELAVYRNGVWWIQNLTNNQTSAIQFGLATDKPVAADYDGDGRTDQAVYRNGEWHLNRSTQGYGVVHFGLAADIPVAADYDGDGRADEAVYRDGIWYLLQSSQGFAAFQWGISTDIPAPADYDGDGRADAAVYRNGVWYLLQSSSGVSIQQFGLANDMAVPAESLPR